MHQVAERLYTQGFISYPRTETTHYPENFDLRSPLKAQQGNSIWGSYVRDLLSNGKSIWLDSEDGAHCAIPLPWTGLQ